MRASNSFIRATKQALYERLATHPYFANIPGFVRIPKSIATKIAERQYPGKGVAFLIGEMRLHVPDSGTPGPFFDSGSVLVEMIENVAMNENTGLPDCDEVGEMAMGLLHLFTPDLIGQCSATVSGWSEEELGDFSIRKFMVNLPMGFIAAELPAMPPVVMTPNVAVGGVYPMTVSLALQTPVAGAAIFYTTDGSFPAPLNPSAQLYQAGPITDSNGNPITDENGNPITGSKAIVPAAGTMLKARGYLAGYQSPQPSHALFS